MNTPAVVLGATGYVGGELLRLLSQHPEFSLAAAVSGSRQGQPIADTFAHLRSVLPTQSFCSIADWSDSIDRGGRVAVFSAAPHGESAKMLAMTLQVACQRDLKVHVVDASADFRYASAADFEAIYKTPHGAPALLDKFTCALPEHVAEPAAANVGHPGCFATAMLLAVMPMFANDLIVDDVFVSAITGSTGSGRSPQAGTHHPERHSNLYAYKALQHRHVPEVERLIKNSTQRHAKISFVPHSGPHARGIYATLQAKLTRAVDQDAVLTAIDRYYESSEFVHALGTPPKLKNVVASNFAHIGAEVADDRVVVMCAIDNLVKGAAGGAVQWMNRLWGLPETTGLSATAPAWT